MNFLGNAPESLSTGVPGWETSAEEGELMYNASMVKKNAVIVEIGGEFGRSAAQFAVATKDIEGVKIFTVDLFPEDHEFAKTYGGLLNVYLNNIAPFQEFSKINPIQGDSAEVALTWKRKIDLLFIDGDHSYAGALRDLENWTKHVKSMGVIAIHDYAKDENAHFLHHEVRRAVDEWHEANPTYKRVDGQGSLVWFQKPKRIYKKKK